MTDSPKSPTTSAIDEAPATKIDDGPEKTVPFTIRFVPCDIHLKWKLIAAVRGISMENLGIEAIKSYIEREYTPNDR